MDLTTILARAENEELDSQQIRIICNGRIVVYHDLARARSLRDVMGADQEIILLYETTGQNVGHWTTMWTTPSGIYFFDPYGLHPDQELRWNTFDKTPYLTRLIQQDGRPLYWNQTDLQAKHEDVNTCGRHSAMRLRWKRLSHDQYAHVLQSKPGLNPDMVVTMLTYVALHDDRHLTE